MKKLKCKDMERISGGVLFDSNFNGNKKKPFSGFVDESRIHEPGINPPKLGDEF